MSDQPSSTDTPTTPATLVTVLHERARDADALPGLPPDLGTVLVRRGRVLRRRRHAVLLGQSALAAAALVVGVATLGPILRSTPAPQSPAQRSATSSAAPSPTASASASASSDKGTPGVDPVVAAIRALPMGRPLTPRLQALRQNGRVTVTDTASGAAATLPVGTGGLVDPVELTGGGWLFTAHGDAFTGGDLDPDEALYLVQGSALRVVHHGPVDGYALSPNGTQIALTEITSTNEGPVHVRVRTLAGVLVADIQAQAGTRVVGWASTGVLVERRQGSAAESTFSWWNPATSTLGPALPYAQMVVSAAPAQRTKGGQAAPIVVAQTRADQCWHVLDVATGRFATTFACGQVGGDVTMSERGDYLVIDARAYALQSTDPDASSRQLLAPATAHLYFWEDPTHVVSVGFATPLPDVYARCDVTTGRCEQAPVPRAADGTPSTIAWDA